MVTLVTNEKQTWEEVDFPFDFSNRGLASSVAIQSITEIVQVLVSGSGSLTISLASYSGQVAQARFSGGVAGSKYKVTCRVVMTDGQKLEADGNIKIKDY